MQSKDIANSSSGISLQSPVSLLKSQIYNLVLTRTVYTVRWQYYSPAGLGQVFPHHRDDTFVVLESYSQARTKVLKFSVDSMNPTSLYSLPFRLLNVASCPASWMLSSNTSSFAFVGVTGSWTAVIFGDQIRVSDDDATGPRNLVHTEPVTKSTLFQDLFGKIALSDSTLSNSAAVYAGSTWKGKEVEKIFETPAYLLPPLGSLFDPLIEEFLTLRSATESVVDEADDDEDAEMAEEGSQAQILVGNRLERIVGSAEMVTMIELFQQNVLHGKHPFS